MNMNLKNTIKSWVGYIKLLTSTNFNSLKLTTIKERKDNLVIIGNGPSVLNCMKYIKEKENCDYMVVNLFPVKNENFLSIKPKYWCSIDNCFFDMKGNRGNDVIELKNFLEKNVNWPFILITPWGLNQNIDNKFVVERKINTNAYKGDISPIIANYMLNNRMCIGLMNVAVAALYAGIIMGYKRIYIYGIDMTFFKDFFVDENNHIVVYEKHFYGTKKIDYTTLYDEVKEKGILRVFETNSEAFRQFKRMRQFADLVGVKIINCTPGSYVDAFVRGK